MKNLKVALVAVAGMVAITRGAWAAAPASDSASSPAYDSVAAGGNGWVTGDNGGTGFGAWDLGASIANSNNDGLFIGSSANNGNVPSGNIDTAGRAWGLFASGSNGVANAFAVGYRPFTGGVLSVGQTVTLKMDNGFIDSAGSGMVGFVLMNSDPVSGNALFSVLPNSNTRFEFLFVGGTNVYQIARGDGAGSYTMLDTGIGFTDGGLSIVFTLTGTNSYSLSINGGAPLTGTLGGTSGESLNGIAVFNYIAGHDSTHDAFFNSLAVLQPTPQSPANLALDTAADSAYAGGWTNASNGGYGWSGPWSFSTNPTGSSGQFLRTSQANGSNDGNIDTLERSWGLWASGGGSITGRRDFSHSLQPGESFVIDLDNGYIETNGSVGFTLDGNGDPKASSQFTFAFQGGHTNYTITTGKYYWVNTIDTGVGFTSKGVHVVVLLGEGGNYSCAITPNGGSTTVISGTGLAASEGLGHVELFNSNAGTGSDHDSFFNNIAIVPPPSVTGFEVIGGTKAVISFMPSRVLRHDLQACTDLVAADWSPVTSGLTGSGDSTLQVSEVFSGSQARRFYRIKASP
jgi:hypothetical protein